MSDAQVLWGFIILCGLATVTFLGCFISWMLDRRRERRIRGSRRDLPRRLRELIDDETRGR